MKSKTSLTLAIGTAFTLGMAASTVSAESGNPFSMTDVAPGNVQLAGMKDGKCGEGKCGAGMKSDKPMKDGKCGGMKDSKDMKDGKCGEGKCGAGMKKSKEMKMKDGKCGEGKCGAGMKK